MDYTQILIAGALGAVGGGVGAALGVGVGRLFPEKIRQTITVIFFVLGVAASQTVTDRFKTQSMANEIRVAMIEESALIAFIAEHFQNEFEATVGAIAKNPKNEFAKAQVFAMTSTIRKENAKFILEAPTSNLFEYITASNDLHTLVRDEFGVEACNSFLLNGTTNIGDIVEAKAYDFENLGLLLFKAIVAGQENKAERSLSTDEDWTDFFSIWLSEDGTEAMQAAITSPATAGDELCNAWTSMAEQLLAMDDPVSERIKAQLVHASAAS